MAEKLPAAADQMPPKAFERLLTWYLTRIYIHVRPERIYVWEDGDVGREPRLFDAHMEEVRSGHAEEPSSAHAPAEGGQPVWDDRMDELGAQLPDGGGLARRAGRLPVLGPRCRWRSTARRGGCGSAARRWACPGSPGWRASWPTTTRASFTWQRNFQVRGDLVEEDGAWAVVPRKLLGGFELPPTRDRSAERA